MTHERETRTERERLEVQGVELREAKDEISHAVMTEPGAAKQIKIRFHRETG